MTSLHSIKVGDKVLARNSTQLDSDENYYDAVVEQSRTRNGQEELQVRYTEPRHDGKTMSTRWLVSDLILKDARTYTDASVFGITPGFQISKEFSVPGRRKKKRFQGRVTGEPKKIRLACSPQGAKVWVWPVEYEDGDKETMYLEDLKRHKHKPTKSQCPQKTAPQPSSADNSSFEDQNAVTVSNPLTPERDALEIDLAQYQFVKEGSRLQVEHGASIGTATATSNPKQTDGQWVVDIQWHCDRSTQTVSLALVHPGDGIGRKRNRKQTSRFQPGPDPPSTLPCHSSPAKKPKLEPPPATTTSPSQPTSITVASTPQRKGQPATTKPPCVSPLERPSALASTAEPQLGSSSVDANETGSGLREACSLIVNNDGDDELSLGSLLGCGSQFSLAEISPDVDAADVSNEEASLQSLQTQPQMDADTDAFSSIEESDPSSKKTPSGESDDGPTVAAAISDQEAPFTLKRLAEKLLWHQDLHELTQTSEYKTVDNAISALLKLVAERKCVPPEDSKPKAESPRRTRATVAGSKKVEESESANGDGGDGIDCTNCSKMINEEYKKSRKQLSKFSHISETEAGEFLRKVGYPFDWKQVLKLIEEEKDNNLYTNFYRTHTALKNNGYETDEATAALNHVGYPFSLNKAIGYILKKKRKAAQGRSMVPVQIGMEIKKRFDGQNKVYSGKVVEEVEELVFVPASRSSSCRYAKVWKVKYDDGEKDDMESHELYDCRADKHDKPRPCLGEPLRFVELFCGKGSVSKAMIDLGFQTESFDIDPNSNASMVMDLAGFTQEYIDSFLKEFLPDVIHASPPCQTFSRAPGEYHRTEDGEERTLEAHEHNYLVFQTHLFIKTALKMNPNLIITIENPRGKLMKQSYTDVMVRELGLEYEEVHYCAFGREEKKPTVILSNNSRLLSLLRPFVCKTRCCMNQVHKKTTEQIKKGIDVAVIPEELSMLLASFALSHYTLDERAWKWRWRHEKGGTCDLQQNAEEDDLMQHSLAPTMESPRVASAATRT